MVLLETYYEIIEKPSVEVSKGWKITHIIIYLIAGASGLVTYILFNHIRYLFEDNCILNSHLVFTTITLQENATVWHPLYELFSKLKQNQRIRNVDENNRSENNLITKNVIDTTKSAWGNETTCDYYEYVPIMSMILGVIFMAYFCLCPRGGSRDSASGIKQPWHIVVPTLILSIVFTIVFWTVNIGISNGLHAFCAEFEPQLNMTKCNEGINDFILRAVEQENVYKYIQLTNAFSIICLLAWITSVVFLIMRSCCFLADFKMMEINVLTIEDEESSSDDSENN